MKKPSEKGRVFLRKIYRILGVSAIALIFQACYGMPMDNYRCNGNCDCCEDDCEDDCLCYFESSKGGNLTDDAE